MKRNAIVILLVFGASTAMLLWSFARTKKYESKIEEIELDLFTWKYSSYLTRYTFLDEGSTVLDSLHVTLLDNSDGKLDTVLFPNILNNELFLVFKISDSHCVECIDSTLDMLNEIVSDNRKFAAKIIILARFESMSELNAWKNSKQLVFRTFFVHDVGRLLKSDEEGKPTIFVLLPDGKVSCLFVPMKENPNLTTNYLRTIIKKYF